MQVKVVGFKKVDYFSQKKQAQVQGVSLYIIRKSQEESVQGMIAQDVWLSTRLVEAMGFVPKPGSDVELIYDYDGRFSSLVGYKLLTPAHNTSSEEGGKSDEEVLQV